MQSKLLGDPKCALQDCKITGKKPELWLQHGGVVVREYGKPCVVGIQGITTTLQDGHLVKDDSQPGVVRILDQNKIQW